jgi:hypothetical protein
LYRGGTLEGVGKIVDFRGERAGLSALLLGMGKWDGERVRHLDVRTGETGVRVGVLLLQWHVLFVERKVIQLASVRCGVIQILVSFVGLVDTGRKSVLFLHFRGPR